jgi:non-canonical (house-cleaning) NTP pyrophosphatase
MERILSYGEELNVAFKNAGFSEELTGDKNGAIGFLTNNKLTRKEYSQQVLVYALSQLHNKHLY